MDRELLLNSSAKIKVIGVGGGGNNAINRMVDANIQSAEFVAVNTDKQVLMSSRAQTVIQIGEKLTKGLGAGADPSVGEKAAEESKDQLRELLKDVDLLFITAGMGGGTGTGAAPVIAQLSKELNILTVAIVTKPFGFEGNRRMLNAVAGVEKLRQYVDTMLVIPNEKIMEVVPKGTSIVEAFRQADEVLREAIQGISDLIVYPALINLDFADVRSIMKDAGYAHMGTGEGMGENKTIDAVRQAVSSPLLDSNIEGSTGVILDIMGGYDLSIDEVYEAGQLVKEVVAPDANIIFGAAIDENMDNKVAVTLIATGFDVANSAVPAKKVEVVEEVAPVVEKAPVVSEQPAVNYGYKAPEVNAEPQQQPFQPRTEQVQPQPVQTPVYNNREVEEDIPQRPSGSRIPLSRELPSFVQKIRTNRNNHNNN